MERGYYWYGMKQIIRLAVEEYGLENVYWCVSRKNDRAIRFYDKHYFHESFDNSGDNLKRYERIDDFKWY